MSAPPLHAIKPATSFLEPRAATAWLPVLARKCLGASAAGTVTQVGAGVPPTYLARRVAIYLGLKAAAPFLGLWCQTAQLPCGTCLYSQTILM